MSNIQLWQGTNGIVIPTTAKNPKDIVHFAEYLTTPQKNKILAAFKIEAYDMAAEYAWKKAMVKLKDTISTLGIKFIGEMLGRADVTETTRLETVLTDFSTIELAEQLGVLGPTAALKLRQANELIQHYFSKNAESELDYNDAFGIVKSSIQYILGEQDISIAIEFSQFRDRLLGESLTIGDPQVEQLINSPLFYIRTTITILLSSIKNDTGAKAEHALANLNLLIKPIWNSIGDSDKWNVGTAYRDVTAAGNFTAASGLKSALLKVGGFDYVPENLRSTTFKTLAKQVLETHYAYNNYHNEPSIVQKLADLGSTIPAPSLIECIQAYMAVYLGNYWGYSRSAAPIALQQLSKITPDRWKYYFEKVIQIDEVVLSKFETKQQVERFKNLLEKNNLINFDKLPKENQALYESIINNKPSSAKKIADKLYYKLKNK